MSAASETIVEIPLALIERGFFQPREYFSQEAMEATKRSIQEKGQKYPVIVRPIVSGNPLFDPTWSETHYELADGERRFRCCKELGFKTLKALVRALSDEEMLDYTLTTNDSLPLNPIEKATVFSRLAKEFGKSQADIAKSFNLKQQQVSEYMRLLELPKSLQDLTARAVISVRHARELLKVDDKAQMAAIALEVQKSSISTRELTKIIKNKANLGKDVRVSMEKMLNEGKKIDNNTILSRNNVYLSEKSSTLAGFGWLEQLHVLLIPRKSYKKLQEWLTFSFASPLSPEFWLVRLEVSLSLGVILALAGLYLPGMVLSAFIGALGALLVYLYIS